MKLKVQIFEARNLPPTDPNGLSDPYVKLQLGKYRWRSKVVKKCLNPRWDEEFICRVDDLNEELALLVMDEDKYFNDDFVGRIRVPMSTVLDAENMTMGPRWFALQPRSSKKSKYRDCGEIYLSICLSQNLSEDNSSNVSSPARKSTDNSIESTLLPSSKFVKSSQSPEPDDENSSSQSIFNRFYQFLDQGYSHFLPGKEPSSSDATPADSETRVQSEKNEINDDSSPEASFDDLMRKLIEKDQGKEMPENLPGGILLDQAYMASPSEVNSLLFSPDSSFFPSLAEFQGSTELKIGPWRFDVGDGDCLKRKITYTKAASKLIKAVATIEENSYLKADGNSFAVLSSVNTPDVPCGSYFRTEVLFCIMPGPALTSEDLKSTRLVVSWRINFLQSTIMKGVIESGARQGLTDSYVQFRSVLSESVKAVDLKDLSSGKEEILATLKVDRESDFRLALRFLGNFTVLSTVFGVLYIIAHVILANPSKMQGLEFLSLDLPDSIGEIMVSVVIVLQVERMFKMIGRFMQARKQKGSDHGVKAQGDGWILTVALIEGMSLATVNASEFSDPYVVFTCNGKTKTSSIKFQTPEPHWNETFEFGAMDDPPSTMDVGVFSFDGPFSEAISLGQAEINFLRSNLSELVDLWVPLQGKLASAYNSRLHLRIFLENTRGTEVPKEYITRMEKEVGKKINLRSPQSNFAFQKLFGLPSEEFLINDFTCQLKRKMPLQGRLFLSRRTIGFHANLFGHKTKFFFLWEDVEDIQVIPPSLASVGSPSLMFILRKGRGEDARHGAKSKDSEGRLKFHFQSFVSFNVASRTIMALWKAKSTASTDQKIQMADHESDHNSNQIQTSPAQMQEVFSSSCTIPIQSMMELFDGGPLENKIMGKVGCEEYTASPWSTDQSNKGVSQREVQFKFDKRIPNYRGEIRSIHRRYPLPDRNGWVVEEAMKIHGVSLGDYINIHLRYDVKSNPLKTHACDVRVSMGFSRLKSTKNQKQIASNIITTISGYLKEVFQLLEKELATR